MAKQTKNGRTIKVTFFVHELQDFIENTHTHTHTHNRWTIANIKRTKNSDLKQPMFLLKNLI